MIRELLSEYDMDRKIPKYIYTAQAAGVKPISILPQSDFVDMVNKEIMMRKKGYKNNNSDFSKESFNLEKLLNNDVNQITVTKPIIEAGGESIGFLKGSEEEKIAPHFQNILDAFEDHIGPTMVKKLITEERIKFIPIGFMRGRDLKNSFIFVDEAQNLTKIGIKLIMTRISYGSQIVLSGDTDQVDIDLRKSGLRWAIDNLVGKHADIAVVKMHASDVCRHPLITTLVNNLILEK